MTQFWTKETPTKAGWYWCKCGKKKRANITLVTKADITHNSNSDPLRYSYMEFVKYWAGPIPFPKSEELFNKYVKYMHGI